MLESGSRRSRRGYAIGVDFGTESGRALLLDLDSGEELGVEVVSYAHGLIDRELPGTGEPLPPDWALQDPDDWASVIQRAVPALLAETGLPGEEVVGIGVDFTSCTVLPTDAAGEPLCRHERWRARRHAWPKLWKHHAAQGVADRLNEVALERGESFLARYGGRISSEWYFPKLIELWRDDRELYDEAYAFIEATDWIVWWMTGVECRQACTAAYKAMWSADDGLPSAEYFEADVDSFVSLPGAGVEQPGTFVMVIGTSICDMVVHPTEVLLPGITGVARDGILPGLYGYEAGQAAVGDMLAWFVRTVGDGGQPRDTSTADLREVRRLVGGEGARVKR